jgi:hypothetical protein
VAFAFSYAPLLAIAFAAVVVAFVVLVRWPAPQPEKQPEDEHRVKYWLKMLLPPWSGL